MSQPHSITVRAQRPHALSASQAKAFLDCAYRWYCEYALKLPAPPSGALALGRALHTAFAACLRGVGAHGRMPEYAAVAEIYAHQFALEFEEARLGEDEDAGQLAELGERMLRVWYDGPGARIAPAAVEIELHGMIAGIEINAIADVITTDGIAIDYKTASKKPASLGADNVLQLATYATLAGLKTARAVTITKTKTPAVIEHTLHLTQEFRRYPEEVYPLVADAMQTGLYLPRRTSNLCSQKHCPFWERCTREFGGEVRA